MIKRKTLTAGTFPPICRGGTWRPVVTLKNVDLSPFNLTPWIPAAGQGLRFQIRQTFGAPIAAPATIAIVGPATDGKVQPWVTAVNTAAILTNIDQVQVELELFTTVGGEEIVEKTFICAVTVEPEIVT